MKKIKVASIILFFIILIIPIIKFNWNENAVSTIDNRELAHNPLEKEFTTDIEFTASVDQYIGDRIGYRDKMIKAYTVINDKLFCEMVHPLYEYGKDKYVFNKVERSPELSEYHVAFADMVQNIQEYCVDRDVPFVFVFNPSKTTVLEDKLKIGINYDTDWVDGFFELLDERNVNYIDNTEEMKKRYKEGKTVFNQKYDAGHWNDLGAFYGINQILVALKSEYPDLYLNSKSDFTITEKLNTSLPVSEFPIYEYAPKFKIKNNLLSYKTKKYAADLEISKNYPYFYYSINKNAKNSYRALVFQGSYLNGKGQKFLANALYEYIGIHAYQNISDFSYYFNIFKPDCVVFEVAEYTLIDDYFSLEKMTQMELNPGLNQYDSLKMQVVELNQDDFLIEQGNGMLSKAIVANLPESVEYVYLQIDDEIFDMRKSLGKNSYEVTLEKTYLDAGGKKRVITVNGNVKREYDIN